MRQRLWWADDPEEKRFLVDRNGFLDSLESSGPSRILRRDALNDLVGRAERNGLPVSANGSVFHKDYSWNCLYHALPQLQEAFRSGYADLRGLVGLSGPERDGRCCPDAARATSPERVVCRPRAIRWQIELTLSSAAGFEDAFVRGYFPRPAVISTQHSIRLIGAWAGTQALELKRMKRFMRMPGTPLRPLLDSQGQLKIRYEYTLEKSEIHAHGFNLPEVVEADLGLPIEKFLELTRTRTTSAWSRAYHLYRWMLANSRFLRGEVGCACNQCAPKKFLVRGGGNCYLLSRAFNAFARNLGLHTRLAFGSLPMFLDPANPRRQVIPLTEYSVFSHFWSEVEIPGVGWLPVDFLPSAYGFGTRSGGPENDFLRKFYFGATDSLRVQVSPKVKGVPLLQHAPTTGPQAPWKPFPARLVSGTASVEAVS